MALEKIVINVSGQADLDSTIKKLVELGVVDQKNADQFKKNSKEQQGLINQLNERIKNLTDARDRSNNPVAIERYNKLLIESKQRLSSLTTVTEKQIGTYGKLKDAANDYLQALPGAQHVQQIHNLTTGINLSTAATGGMAKAMNVLKIAMAATGIGALILALGALFAYFKKTESGSEALERGLAKVGAAVDVIIGKFANLGKGIVQLFSGEWKNALNTFQHAFDNIGKEIDDAVTKAGSFTEVLQDIEDKEKLLSVRVAETRNEIQRLLIESRNRALSESKRLELLLQAEALEKQIISEQIALQQQKVDALKQENELKIKTGELDKGNKTDELIAAEIELANLRGNSLELLEKIRNREELLLDAQKERADKEKDYWEMRKRHMAEDLNLQTKTNDDGVKAFDASENIKKDLNEKYLKIKDDQRKEDEARAKATLDRDLKEAEKAAERKKQLEQAYTEFAINTINQVMNAKLEADRIKMNNEITRLHNETNAQSEALDKQVAKGIISAEQAARAKEVLQDRQKQRENQIKTKQAQQEKNFALYQIAIDTAAAIIKQLAATPLPAGAPLVALIAASGAVQAAIVASRPTPQFKEGGYTGDGNPNAEAGIVHKAEFVMPADKTSKYRKELEAMYSGNYREPIRLERSLSDIRHDNMADNIYKSMMYNGMDDSRIVSAIAKNNKVKLGNSDELAGKIAGKISDRLSEGRLYA